VCHADSAGNAGLTDASEDSKADDIRLSVESVD